MDDAKAPVAAVCLLVVFTMTMTFLTALAVSQYLRTAKSSAPHVTAPKPNSKTFQPSRNPTVYGIDT